MGKYDFAKVDLSVALAHRHLTAVEICLESRQLQTKILGSALNTLRDRPTPLDNPHAKTYAFLNLITLQRPPARQIHVKRRASVVVFVVNRALLFQDDTSRLALQHLARRKVRTAVENQYSLPS